MVKRIFAAPGFVTLVAVALAATLVAVAFVIVSDPLKKAITYCATMPDAIGLYTGNHVTVRGIPVGAVTGLRPDNGAVHVDFTVDADHRLRGDVTATTVSDTLVADRDLEVLGDARSRTDWNPSICIGKTFTPKSITDTLRTFSTLADQLIGDKGTGDHNNLRDSVRDFQQATAGTGPRLNQLITDLGAALRRPDAAIGHIGALIDAFGSLMSSIAANWSDIKTALLQAGPGITLVNDLWREDVELIDSLAVVLPWLDDIARKYGHHLLNGLDQVIPYMRMTSANIATLQQIIDMIPAVVDAFQRSVDPATGRVQVTYAPPKAELPQQDADRICVTANAVAPGRCRTSADGLAAVDLVTLVLGTAGAR
ncbi:MlaD family protein [Nocardia terpenica]|uniref:MCE family protein n=1 Tax=Nocardia terpenica TaxID=455432 RepID=A0A6G9ZD71_9NOCA|nr:MlaD family protein [Nocardia terpenica]QIS23380.1 MCE family protein [Nocardia terpenica]